MQPGVLNQGQDYTEWELPDIYMKQKETLRFLENWKIVGRNLKKMLNIKVSW